MELKEIIEKIKERTIEDGTGCWLFQGINNKGYGSIKFNGKMVSIHRISAAYYLGLDLTNRTKQANHKIACSYKNCWNPNHLYIGTQSENKADRIFKREEHTGNQYTNATHCIHGHEFTPENTYDYGHGRKCKQCEKDR